MGRGERGKLHLWSELSEESCDCKSSIMSLHQALVIYMFTFRANYTWLAWDHFLSGYKGIGEEWMQRYRKSPDKNKNLNHPIIDEWIVTHDNISTCPRNIGQNTNLQHSSECPSLAVKILGQDLPHHSCIFCRLE